MWKLKLFYSFQGTFIFEIIKKVIFWKWHREGCPLPAPYTVKREKIKELAREFKCKIFVEPGTYLGATTAEMVKDFKEVYTIELNAELFRRAKRKLAKYKNVTVLHGDSGKLLIDVIQKIDATVFFWLDGHYSGGVTSMGEKSCPIYEELQSIFKLKNIDYVIMIDDARDFENPMQPEYPSIADLERFVNENSPLKMKSENKMDIISFQPAIKNL